MDTILETVLTWFNPINAGFFLLCLGAFIWLSSRSQNYGEKK